MSADAGAAAPAQAPTAEGAATGPAEGKGGGRPDWQGARVTLAADGLPAPLRWRPVFLWKALALGFLFDLGAEVLLQQLGKQVLTTWDLFGAAVVGAIVGVVAPSIGRAAGVWWANHHLRAARAAASALREVPP